MVVVCVCGKGWHVCVAEYLTDSVCAASVQLNSNSMGCFIYVQQVTLCRLLHTDIGRSWPAAAWTIGHVMRWIQELVCGVVVTRGSACDVRLLLVGRAGFSTAAVYNDSVDS